MKNVEVEFDPADYELMIVDDNPTNLEVIIEYLDKLHFGTRIARSGEAAIRSASYAKPDLILLDVQMPGGMNGFETCRRLKSNEKTADIPVIFMTAFNDNSSIIEGFSSGAVDYVTKPIQQEELLARVTVHLKNHTLNHHLQMLVDQQTHDLLEAIEAAENANHAKTKFFNQISHELRTPLTSILLYVELLQNQYKSQPKKSRYLDIIQRNGMSLRVLVEQLLAFSQLVTEPVHLQPESINLFNFLNHIQDIQQNRYAERPILFEVIIDQDVPPFFVTDQKRLEYILLELTNNAFNNTKEGKIDVVVTTVSDRNTLHFAISDSGDGIPQKDGERIFKPFEQYQKPNQLAKGIGLGLTTCRQLIKAMGGDLHLESKVGIGTTLSFEIKQ